MIELNFYEYVLIVLQFGDMMRTVNPAFSF